MRAKLTALIVLVFAGFAVAAEPARESPVDTSFVKKYAETRGFMLGRPVKPKFTPDGMTVLFLRSEATTPKQKLFAFDVATGKTSELLSSETLLKGADENLTAEEKARRERQRVNVGGFADFFLDPAGKRVLVMLAGKPYVFEIANKQVTELSVGKGTIVDPKWSPDGKLVSYVRDHDVSIYDLATSKELAVTIGGTAIKTHGLAEFVAQEEMGRHTGYWWSPDSKFIAYEEADHTGVEVWSISDPLRPDVKAPEQFYPRPGKKNVSVRLGVKPVTDGETVWIEWDHAKYEYLAAVKWELGGGNGPTLLVQNRKQQDQKFLLAIPDTGKTKELFEEKAATWLNLWPEVPLYTGGFGSFVWFGNSPDGPEIQCRGFNGRIVEINVRAKDQPLDLVAINIREWNELDVMIGYHVAPDPTQKQVRFRKILQTKTSPVSETEGRLTTVPGQSTATFSPSMKVLTISTTTITNMPATSVSNIDGTIRKILPSVALEPDFQPNVTIQKVSDYWTAIVRPKDFDPKKKYPVIVDVYGGPRHLHVVQAMKNWLIPQWIADQGFIVVAIENRGTPGRGRVWEQAIYQKFGTVPLDDQAKGLAALGEKFPELDLSRVGIIGWSFGGYMAANAVLRKPDVFHAAVAGAPVTDWEDYDTHYTERYMGVLPESKQAYDEASLLPLAKDLRRPLLLVHGTADDNVYFRHTLRLTDALTRAGKTFEVLPLPGVTHMVTADPVAFEQYYSRSIKFFHLHLGSPK